LALTWSMRRHTKERKEMHRRGKVHLKGSNNKDMKTNNQAGLTENVEVCHDVNMYVGLGK